LNEVHLINTKQNSINRKLNIKLAIYLAITVIVVIFIFSNSLQNRSASSAMSTGVADFLKPIPDLLGITTDEGFHGLLRKLAHAFEFAVLGVCSGGIMWCWAEKQGRYHIASAVLFPFIVAVMDEFIQSFSDRASEVRDVLIDFGGALVGIAVLSLVKYLIIRKTK